MHGCFAEILMKLHYHPLNKTLILLEVLEDMVTKLFPGHSRLQKQVNV